MKREDNAVCRRHKAGETYGSIAVSLGRTEAAVKSRGDLLTNPKAAPRQKKKPAAAKSKAADDASKVIDSTWMAFVCCMRALRCGDG